MADLMNLTAAFFLIIICIIVTKTDLKTGIISNKIVVGMGLLPVIINCIGITLEKGWFQYINNASVIIIIAVMLYSLHIWAGGDCKLMILISLASPPSMYWDLYSQSSTLWYIYAFTFSFGFIYVCFENIKFLVKDRTVMDKRELLLELKRGIFRYIRTIVYLTALGHVYIFCIYPYVKLPTLLYAVCCLAVVFIITRMKIMKSICVMACIAVLDGIAFIFTGNLAVNKTWYVYVIVIFFMLFRAASHRFNYEDIKTELVKKGMILSQESSVILQNSRVKGLPGVSDETLKSRLTEAEAEAIVRWKSSKYGQEYVRIVRKVPFAIYITLGLICYYVLGSVFF